ncbi:MAG: DNA-binding protein [Chloroflexota bacterium]|nr:DNA-binding protein [Chloroflexota bacterium]
MSTLQISLPDDRLRALEKLSGRLNIPPEELVRISIEEILTRPEEEYQRAVKYILEKNSELYDRLAS